MLGNKHVIENISPPSVISVMTSNHPALLILFFRKGSKSIAIGPKEQPPSHARLNLITVK